MGSDILNKISREINNDVITSLEVAENIILYHHEKWDGTGYPHGLKGEDIPLEARIVAIVDVFDAWTSRRPYKDSWSVERALSFINEQKGKHFYPSMVVTFFCFLKRLRSCSRHSDINQRTRRIYFPDIMGSCLIRLLNLAVTLGDQGLLILYYIPFFFFLVK